MKRTDAPLVFAITSKGDDISNALAQKTENVFA